MKIVINEAEFTTLREALNADIEAHHRRELVVQSHVANAAWRVIRARGLALEHSGPFCPQVHFNEEMGRIVLTTESGEQPWA